MKIYIDQIPEAGLELTENCEPSSLDLNRADIKFTEPIKLSAQISKGINNISVKLEIDAAMHLNCSRCLEEFTAPLSKKINLDFPIENRTEIDIAGNLREEIILSHPLKPLCRSDCRGLCTICGQNLNKKKCNCKDKNAYS
ncbi:MAG: DUF177 domain-containing protein [Candidatus Omnitrophica bacterium]|nr:DUF177 domain-containing protein [Candidatus Omnitrophota bacterium]